MAIIYLFLVYGISTPLPMMKLMYTSLNITDVSDTLQISPRSPYGLRLGKHSVDDPSLHLLINSLATRVTFETNSISRPYDYCFYDPLEYG